MPDEYELMKMTQILEANKHKSFVKRILTPEEYPTLNLGQDSYATHKMSWITTEDDNGNPVHRVFPTVLYNEKKQLQQFDPRTAYDHVLKTGNYIDFKTPEEADVFSKRYKAVWGE